MNSQEVLINLSIAIRKNDIEAVKNILFKYPAVVKPAISDLPEGMYTPLWEAMMWSRKDITKVLIDSGADINEPYLFAQKTLHGLTFLQTLPCWKIDFFKRIKDIALVLIEYGADVNSCIESSLKTPLQVSMEMSNLDCIEFFLENGAKFSNPEWDRVSLINLVLRAPKSKQKEILQLLVKHNLDTKVRDNQGQDYLQLTLKKAAKFDIDVIEITKILLDSGVPINGVDNHGKSSLLYAVETQNLELLSLIFVEKGADINEVCEKFHGYFPLFSAVRFNNINLLDWLLSNGAEIHLENSYGQTALHGACYYRYEKVIKFLIDKGADTTLEDKNGNTPFLYLKPRDYNESNIPFINLMIKIFAELKFFNPDAVSNKDMSFIRANPAMLKYFQSCVNELFQTQIKNSFKPYYLDFSFTKFLLCHGIDPFA